jgi:fumarylacetoacetase
MTGLSLDRLNEVLYLADGDQITISAWATGPTGSRLGLGEVTGRIKGS